MPLSYQHRFIVSTGHCIIVSTSFHIIVQCPLSTINHVSMGESSPHKVLLFLSSEMHQPGSEIPAYSCCLCWKSSGFFLLSSKGTLRRLSRSSQSLWIASTWQRMQMQLALKYDQREGGRGEEHTREKDNRARGLKPHPEAEHGLTTLRPDRLLYHTADHQVHQSIHLTTKCTRAHQSEQTCPLWFNAELD